MCENCFIKILYILVINYDTSDKEKCNEPSTITLAPLFFFDKLPPVMKYLLGSYCPQDPPDLPLLKKTPPFLSIQVFFPQPLLDKSPSCIALPQTGRRTFRNSLNCFVVFFQMPESSTLYLNACPSLPCPLIINPLLPPPT